MTAKRLLMCESCVSAGGWGCFSEQVDALDKRRHWEETRRRCEVWAHKLDSCDCLTGRTTLAGYAEGGGPTRACLRAMHPSIQEGYCKALR